MNNKTQNLSLIKNFLLKIRAKQITAHLHVQLHFIMAFMAKTGTFLKQLGTLGFSILLYPRKQHPDTIVSYT